MNNFYLKNITLLFLSSIICPFAIAQNKNLEQPKAKKNENIIRHEAYSFVYSEDHEQSKWIAYKLTAEMLESNVERSNYFKKDPDVTTETADNNDYKGSGYDKGHLAPAADMCFSKITMEESFYFSNISPQKPGFNRGIWKSLEKETRGYAEQLNKIYIVTGPILKDGLLEIGDNKVDIPEQYYKAILYISDTSIQSIAFVLPNEKTNSDMLYQYAISINELEKLLKINLFYKLPYFIEKKVEKSINVEFWRNLNP